MSSWYSVDLTFTGRRLDEAAQLALTGMLRKAIWAKVAFPCAEKVQVFGSAPARDENQLRHDIISPVVLLMSDQGFAVAEERVQELGA